MSDVHNGIERATPWPLILLAVLPGVAMVLGVTINGTSWLRMVLIGAMVAPGVAGLIIAIARRALGALPAWSLLSVGFLLFIPLMFSPSAPNEAIVIGVGLSLLLVALGAVVWRVRPGKPPLLALWLAAVAAAASLLQLAFLGGNIFDGSLISWIYLTPAAAAGLLLAPAHGLRAVLVLLPAAAFIMGFYIEHPIYFWEARNWSRMLSIAMPSLLLVLLPVWVLRARSPVGQAVGLLVPPALYYLLLVTALVTNSFATDWNHIFSIARPVVGLFSGLAVFGAVCVWLAGTNGEIRNTKYEIRVTNDE